MCLSQNVTIRDYHPGVNERGFIELISGKDRGIMASAARLGLRCLSPFYSAAVRLRNAAYTVGIAPEHRAAVPVVSVGNMTTGGTGKTPIVAMIAQWFTKQGHRPCLLSRGYRSLDEAGNDEKRLLEQLCPGVPHVQNPDRTAGSKIALSEHRASVLVLDDGFQHRRLARDLNIVLIDATNPFGFGFVLPRGLLREPLGGLKRADLVIITRVEQVTDVELEQLDGTLRAYDVPIAHVAFTPTELVRLNGSMETLGAIENEVIGAFCGIGNPAAFKATLKAVGLTPVFFEAFPDHCHFDNQKRQRLLQLAHDHGATSFVCTEKDLVKLRPFEGVELFGIRIEAVVQRGKDDLETALLDTVAERTVTPAVF